MRSSLVGVLAPMPDSIRLIRLRSVVYASMSSMSNPRRLAVVRRRFPRTFGFSEDSISGQSLMPIHVALLGARKL